MKISQKKKVVQQLKEHGFVSRNWCLGQRITRLSAIIQDLEEEGFVFVPYRNEGDYCYRMADKPKRIVSKVVIKNGVAYQSKEEVPLF